MNQLQTYLYNLFACGLICSVLLLLQGNTASKNGLEVGCACVMLIVFLSPLASESLYNTAAALKEGSISEQAMHEISSDAELYAKQVMQEEYSAYILSRAKELGISLSHITVETVKYDDCWIPYSIIYRTDQPIDQAFFEQMESSLGVPTERQIVYEAAVAY